MANSPPATLPIVQVALCSAEDAVVSRIEEYSNPDFARTRVTRLTSISDLSDPNIKPPEVIIVDVTDDCDTDSLFGTSARKLLANSLIIVLCSSEESEKWQRLVLHQEIDDCFIIRPLHDPGYLHVQIWRAIRSSLEKRLDDGHAVKDSDEPNSDELTSNYADLDASEFAGKHVLVLEDDDPSAEALTDMLTGFGFVPKRASSVVDACRKFSEIRFDIFLVDLMMPGISGSKVLHVVREHFEDAKAPIIVISAHSDDDLVRQCIEEGASDYIVKPLTRSRLLPSLRSALNV
jgi:CheY-like chemotaxis protein